MIDSFVGGGQEVDDLIQRARTATDKVGFVYDLRLLHARGRPVSELVGLARDYNERRALPNYQVTNFVIEDGNGGFNEVDVKTGEVREKRPYQVLPVI